MLVPAQRSTLEKMMKQQRGHRHKHIVQAVRTLICRRSLGQWILGAIGRSGQKPLQKKENTRWTTLSYTSGHKEVSSVCSRKFHVRDAVAVNTSQKTADETGQPSVLKHREDPGMIDDGKGSRKVRQ